MYVYDLYVFFLSHINSLSLSLPLSLSLSLFQPHLHCIGLRILAAQHMRANPADYLPFLDIDDALLQGVCVCMCACVCMCVHVFACV